MKNSHYAGPAYCVGYCGNNGVVTRNANANLARTNNRRYWTMKLVETKTTKTGTNFEGNRAGCICNGL